MRIAIVSMDTRGGIQPYLALGLGLLRAGHDVRVVAPSDFATMIGEVGLHAVPLAGSVEEVVRSSGGAAEKGSLATTRLAMREIGSRIDGWMRTTLEACADADVITGGIGGMVVAASVAEKLGRPFVEAHLHPVGAPTDAYPAVLFPRTPRWLGRWAMRAGHHLTDWALRAPFERASAAARTRALGLTGRPRRPDGPVLYGLSRHVVPMPESADRERHVTGYWFLPAPPTWQPPRALEELLADGGAPVVSVGFGSMASSDPAATAALVTAAARRAGVRVVMLSGWGGLRAVEASRDVIALDAVPHDWLFPRVAGVVHHGGAGTTGAALRAGVPSLVVPFMMDQPFWGARVATLGVGPAPIPRPRLSEASLAAALRRMVEDDAMRARAADLGTRIRAEDGVATAVAVFERIESRGHGGSHRREDAARIGTGQDLGLVHGGRRDS